MSENVGETSATEETVYKQDRKKNISGELDVFEATQYFSDFNEPTIIESSRTQIQKQNTVQKRVHPDISEQLPKPRAVVVIKPQKKKKLPSFLKSLLRSVGLKKSKSIPEVEITKKMRRKSCVIEASSSSSPMTCVGSWSLNLRRRSFDERHVKGLKKSDEKLISLRFCKDQNGGFESDSSSESDLFDLDLFAKSNH